jgi:hypothetical protein
MGIEVAAHPLYLLFSSRKHKYKGDTTMIKDNVISLENSEGDVDVLIDLWR